MADEKDIVEEFLKEHEKKGIKPKILATLNKIHEMMLASPVFAFMHGLHEAGGVVADQVKDNLKKLDEFRVNVLGKSGVLTASLKEVAAMSEEDKKTQGLMINEFKKLLAENIEAGHSMLEGLAMAERLSAEKVDVTLPVEEGELGRIHPLSRVKQELYTIFSSLGFKVASGPDIEDDFHNFQALNVPPNHPARQMQDTFFLKSENVLRTQTSSIQIREMIKNGAPIKIVGLGSVYRHDYDQTHSPMFHQIEGLVIDEKTNMGDLRGVMADLFSAFFNVPDLGLRFRPSFFPFTEPSAEIDIACKREKNSLTIGNFGDFLEVGGCGMVHPNVLKACGVDPEKYQGYAFGMGIDRMAMLKYGIPDIRSFFEADIRWIKHFGFLPFEVPTNFSGIDG